MQTPSGAATHAVVDVQDAEKVGHRCRVVAVVPGQHKVSKREQVHFVTGRRTCGSRPAGGCWAARRGAAGGSLAGRALAGSVDARQAAAAGPAWAAAAPGVVG